MRLLVGAFALMSGAACASATGIENPDLVGVVTDASEVAVGAVRVSLISSESRLKAEVVNLFLSPSTKILVHASDGSLKAGTRGDIVDGLQLTAVIGPAEYRSLPPAYDAVRIIVEAAPQK